MNYQGINKPAFYSYSFLNKLGDTELLNADSSSFTCKNSNGDIQVLFWDFSNTHPGDSVNNQVYFLRDLPARPKGKVQVRISGIPEGNYLFEIYQTGYRVNDPYASYLVLNRPGQLTRQQVDGIKKLNDGSPVLKEIIKINSAGIFSKELEIRENDVFLFNLTKL